MNIYPVICTATLPKADPVVEITECFRTLREAEEYFARTMELYEDDVRYTCDLTDGVFIAHSQLSNIKYYYEIHKVEVN